MRNKFLAWVSAVSAVALVSGILIVSANAHIGASHSPFDTDGPDLVSASVSGDDEVKFCFDEEVAEEDANTDETQYELRGFDSEQIIEADSLDLGAEDECIDVTFSPPGDQEVSAYTVALIEKEEVEDRGGDTAPAGAVQLDGSVAPGEGPGSTGSGASDAAPNLTDWTAHAGTNTISYFFDEVVDCALLNDDAAGADDDADGDNFGFYEEDEATGGTAESTATGEDPEIALGDDILDCDGNEVEVQFSLTEAGGDEDKLEDRAINPATDEDVEDADKVWVSGTGDVGGLGADPGTGSTPSSQVCDPDLSGATTDPCLDEEMESSNENIDDAPDLTDAERTDDTKVTFTFDENIDDDDTFIEDELFYIAFEDGQELFADGAADDCSADNKEVECDFDNAGAPADLEDMEDNEIPVAGVGDCAVHVDDSNTEPEEACSTIGVAPLSTSQEDAGFTDAPDLEDCDLDVTGEQVTYFFDEDVDEDVTTITGADFYVFDQEGDETSGDTGDPDDVEDNAVTVDYENEDLSDKIGCGVVEDAVSDEQDADENLNVEATVGTAPGGSSGGTTGTASTTTTVTSTSTTTTRTPVTRRIPTTLTGRYAKKAGAFKGTVGSARAGCVRGRLVTVKKAKSGKTVGTDTSSKGGGWKVRKPRARGRYKAHVAKKVFTAGNGDKIVCLADDSPAIRVRRR